MRNKCFIELPASLAENFKLSLYNLYLDEGRMLVYNTISQSVARFDNRILSNEDKEELLENGFIVEKDVDELDAIRKEYDLREQFSKELQLIIAMTLDCQFRCFYCYENHPKIYMKEDIKNSIISLVEKKASEGKNISIVWYGGEPMLDFASIRTFTDRIREICTKYGVGYKAAMISNGYLFDDTSISEIDKLEIESIQITLDGMKEVHEKRRPMMGSEQSFERILNNICRLFKETSICVRLRINVDKSNIESAHELLEYCAEMGLEKIDVTLGMMKEFGCDHVCTFGRKNLFSMEEFSNEFMRFRKHAEILGFENAVAKMMPEYKVNSCTMDCPEAYVIDPNGYVYKCISQVGQIDRSIGNVKSSFDEFAHRKCNVFAIRSCTNCKYFPICKGGCLQNNAGDSKECNIWKYLTEKILIDEIEKVPLGD